MFDLSNDSEMRVSVERLAPKEVNLFYCVKIDNSLYSRHPIINCSLMMNFYLFRFNCILVVLCPGSAIKTAAHNTSLFSIPQFTKIFTNSIG
jgi:hypothetical protein